ncbi:MAG: hypothetical protein KBD66_03995 [Candidatus Doudnabacteria bacterium]|nr:hypothetical protein [Candidatus Doudnabacteria bacterium]
MQFALEVVDGPELSELFAKLLEEESESCFNCRAKDGRQSEICLGISSISRLTLFDEKTWLLIRGRHPEINWPEHFVLYEYQTKKGFAFPFHENQGMLGLPRGAEEVIREMDNLHWKIYGTGNSEAQALSILRYSLYGALVYGNGITVSARDYHYWARLANNQS